MSYQEFPATFLLLQQEGHLIQSCLTNGLTELRAAHVHNKGAFYSSLFNLSIGMERLLKSAVIIDHMLRNNMVAPTVKQLKGYGHNIIELFDACGKIAEERSFQFPDLGEFDEIDNSIISLLSDFALITRYHNLDSLSTSQNKKDPLHQWSDIMLNILDADVKKSHRDKVLAKAELVAKAIDDIAITVMHGLDKTPLTTEQALSLPGLHELAVKYAVFRLVKVIVAIRDFIADICHLAYGLGFNVPPFPQMQEFLSWAWDDKQYAMRKKKWP